MKTQRQQRTYALLGFVTAALLMVAQVLSQQALRAATSDLSSAKGNYNMMKQNVQSRTDLAMKYKELESAMLASGRDNYVYPENALALYAVVDNAFSNNQVEHTNKSSSSNTVPGGILELRLTFDGSYYSVLKTLGAIRESMYLMKIADLTIEADSGAKVKGTVTILSIAKS